MNNGTDQISLGELSYSITGDTDPLERKLAELERERTLKLSFDLDDAAIASLNAKLQEAIKPIPITLDTTAAEAQLSAMLSAGGSVGGGGGVGGEFTSNLGMLSLPAYELQGMGYPRLGPLVPLASAAGVGAAATAAEIAGPPNIAALEQASAQANVAEMTRAMQENAYANLAGGDVASEGMTGAAAASGGTGFRRMAGFYVAARGLESLYTQISAERDEEDIMHRSGTAEDNSRDMIADLRRRNEGFAGMGKGMLASFMHFQDAHPILGDLGAGVIPETFRMLGYTADDFDIDKQIQTLQQTDRSTKENERRQIQANHHRQHLDTLIGRADEMKESLGDEYLTTVDKGGVSGALAKIDAGLNKRIDEINKLADAMEHSGDPRGHENATRYRESMSMLAKTTAGEQRRKLTDEDNFNLEIERRTDDALEAAMGGHTLDSQLQKLYIASSQQSNKLNPTDANFNARMQEITRRENLGTESAFLTAYDKYSRGHLAMQDRIAGIDAETAAVNRGSSLGALEEQVSTIFRKAMNEATDLRLHSNPQDASDVSNLAISQLKLLQAQLSKTHGEAADANFTYLGQAGQDKDEVANLLREINTSIQNLQINLRVTP